MKRSKARWSASIPSTQNPERLTPREGSTPSSGTIKSTPFRHLRRPRLHTAPCAKTAVGQPWGNSRESAPRGQGGPSGPRPTVGVGGATLAPSWASLAVSGPSPRRSTASLLAGFGPSAVCTITTNGAPPDNARPARPPQSHPAVVVCPRSPPYVSNGSARRPHVTQSTRSAAAPRGLTSRTATDLEHVGRERPADGLLGRDS